MRTSTSVMARRLTILGRIQAMRLKLASQRLALQAALVVLAIVLGVGGIGMLMLCLYTLMAEAFGLVVGALAAGGLLLAMALAAILFASRVKPPAEAQLLDHLEETVIADMSADLAEFENGFKRLEAGTKALFRGDYLSAVANLAGSLR